MKDKISVIIPCYNVEKYIMRCFQSIYAQTYGFEHLEVIFIDDLSTDHTYTIIESLQKRYPQNVIAVSLQKKGMAGGARNVGLDIASGAYLWKRFILKMIRLRYCVFCLQKNMV